MRVRIRDMCDNRERGVWCKGDMTVEFRNLRPFYTSRVDLGFPKVTGVGCDWWTTRVVGEGTFKNLMARYFVHIYMEICIWILLYC